MQKQIRGTMEAADTTKLQIGSLTLANRFLLAPLAGISDIAFRTIAKEQGAALVCTEMISAKALEQKNKTTYELLRYLPEEKPVAVQIFGHEPDVMAGAAATVEELGFDLIDINMGCPVPKVVGNGDGSALLKDPELAAGIVTAVKRAVKCPVTVKMRIGIGGKRDKTNIPEHIASGEFAADFAARMEQAGADAVTVHGRLREQFYSGSVNLDAIAAVKRAVSIPVIGNGDIKDPESARAMFEQTGCDGLMIGRAAIGNPWIFGRLIAADAGTFTGITLEDKARMLLEQARRSVEVHGEPMGIVRMRGIGGWYFKGMRNAARIRDRIHSVSTFDELAKVVEDVVRR